MNLHTVIFPGEEIRGQLQVVPEPATGLLVMGGVLGLAAIRRNGAFEVMQRSGAHLVFTAGWSVSPVG